MVQWVWTRRDESFFDAIPGIDLGCSRGRGGERVGMGVVVVVVEVVVTVVKGGEVKFRRQELSGMGKRWGFWNVVKRSSMTEDGVRRDSLKPDGLRLSYSYSFCSFQLVHYMAEKLSNLPLS
ncbi:hypothetical protein SDJN03_16191, partial [Cucurbita argyrosperma subsp. sororia]